MCTHVCTCVCVNSPQQIWKQQAVAHESCLEPRGLYLVLVWLGNILSSDPEIEPVLKPIFIISLVTRQQTLKPPVGGFEGHRARVLSSGIEMQFADHISLFSSTQQSCATQGNKESEPLRTGSQRGEL